MKTYRYYRQFLESTTIDVLLFETEAHNLGEADRLFHEATGIELPDARLTVWEKQ